MQSDYLLEEYVSVTAGEPYRLFPFGRIVKDGEVREITPELAAKFKLPHFLPPIKRGGHAEDAPAGGHIKALEVREDGLWAIPEFNEKGAQAVADGDYRYHSPEVIWSDGPVFENPDSGEFIHGPLIVGDALLHMPHLGEHAALYSVEPITREVNNMAEEMTRLEKFQAWFEDKFETPEPAPEPDPEPEVKEIDIAAEVAKGVEEAFKKLPAKPTDVKVTKDEADQEWESDGEFFIAVKNAALYPGQFDKRLLPLEVKATGMSENVPADGGYLLASQVAPGLIEPAHVVYG